MHIILKTSVIYQNWSIRYPVYSVVYFVNFFMLDGYVSSE